MLFMEHDYWEMYLFINESDSRWESERKRDRQTDRQADRLTDRQTGTTENKAEIYYNLEDFFCLFFGPPVTHLPLWAFTTGQDTLTSFNYQFQLFVAKLKTNRDNVTRSSLLISSGLLSSLSSCLTFQAVGELTNQRIWLHNIIKKRKLVSCFFTRAYL